MVSSLVGSLIKYILYTALLIFSSAYDDSGLFLRFLYKISALQLVTIAQHPTKYCIVNIIKRSINKLLYYL